MNKKNLGLAAALLLLASVAMAQQKLSDGTGGGSITANTNAVLELSSTNKGLLHTRIALVSTSDAAPLSAHVAGMMVYNTATANDVKPGIYYNDGTKWLMVTAGAASSISYDPTTYIISYNDINGDPQTINLVQAVKDNETKTLLVNNGEGKYTYYNEDAINADGTPDLSKGVLIDVPASVIQNFETIVNNQEVRTTLLETISNTYVGGNVYYDGEQFTYIDQSGETHVVNVRDIVQANETVTVLRPNDNGTYTYFNESAFDENGDPIEASGVIINIPASVVENFENIYNQIVNEEIIVNGDEYNSFEHYLTTIVTNNTNFKDNEFIVITGTGTATDPFEITIKEGDANSMLITNEDGDLEWATIEGVVQDVQKTVTLVDGTNTTIESNVAGNNTEYKVNVATAKGADGSTAANLGLVKEAAVNPTVAVSQSGELSINLEFLNAVRIVDADYTLTEDDMFVLGNADNGTNVTITLPAATAENKGKKYTIKKEDADEDGYVTVVGTIVGVDSGELYTAVPFTGWGLISDGSAWRIVNKF